jgi:PKD repeat protein
MAHLENTHNRSSSHFITSYHLEDREFGSRIQILLQGWQLTGNRKYLDQAIRLSNLVGAGSSAYYLQCPCPADPSNSTYVGPLFMGWLLRSLGWLGNELQVIDEGKTIAYALMATDGLALAYIHSGNSAYLDTARRLFRSTMAAPFGGPGWQFGTYAIINEEGKYAEFGGTYIAAAHSEPPPENSPPVAAYSVNPASGPAPLLVNADASVSFDPDGNVVSYRWNWGDGTPEESGSSPYAPHTYQEGPATRTITLAVRDDRGAASQTSVQVVVKQPKTIQSIRGTVRMKSTKGSGIATIQFNIARVKDKEGYQGSISIRDDAARFSGQATLKPGDPVSPCAPNGATGVAAGTARSNRHSGRFSLVWQVLDLSSIGQGGDWVSLSATGNLTYSNSGPAISGDITLK